MTFRSDTMNTLTRAQDTAAATRDDKRPGEALQPPVDVIEDPTGITLYADMPGVPRDKLQLRVEGDQLLLDGEIELAVTQGMESAHAEVTRPRYRRAFTLSKELDATGVSAELSQGVLRVRIPKAAHAQPRRIEVKVN
jgi:HSP20 family protein